MLSARMGVGLALLVAAFWASTASEGWAQWGYGYYGMPYAGASAHASASATGWGSWANASASAHTGYGAYYRAPHAGYRPTYYGHHRPYYGGYYRPSYYHGWRGHCGHRRYRW
jgi:hypothetical protein